MLEIVLHITQVQCALAGAAMFNAANASGGGLEIMPVTVKATMPTEEPEPYRMEYCEGCMVLDCDFYDGECSRARFDTWLEQHDAEVRAQERDRIRNLHILGEGRLISRSVQAGLDAYRATIRKEATPPCP